ncbi:MAG: CRTAC1 family protein [Trueperaceae bacterium]
MKFIYGLIMFSFAWVFAVDKPVAEALSFLEEAQSGITQVYDGGWEFFVGGGVATFDCSGDGKPDVFLAGGSHPAALYKNVSEVGGALRFEKVAGLEPTRVTGAYPIDIDNDDIIDLAVLRVGENELYRGLGDCTFERANTMWNISGGDNWTTAFSAMWEDEQTLPTLVFGNYIDRYDPKGPFAVCEDNVLYRPDGPSYTTPIKLSPGYCALSMLFTDWSLTGKRDLYITNDRQYYLTNQDKSGSEQLWTFNDDVPKLYSEADGWQKLQIWGMGIAMADVTGDGLLEFYLTSMADQKLRTLADTSGKPTYKDLAFERGVTVHRPFTGGDIMPSTGWHAEFDDVNNDGLLDLFVAKGNVDSMLDFAQNDPNNLLLANQDGTFTEVADKVGVLSMLRGRGATLTDFNLDGQLDMLVVNRRDKVQIWRNNSKELGNWLQLRLSQSDVNRYAIGAWLNVEAGKHILKREITMGGGHVSGELGWIHVGLGDAERATVTVTWSDDSSTTYTLNANQFATLEKGESEPKYWQP